jgi:hypothetical protein
VRGPFKGPDDLHLTSQELTYLATSARLLAEQAQTDAERQGSVSVRGIFQGAERVYLELAEKCTRLAELTRAVADAIAAPTPRRRTALYHRQRASVDTEGLLHTDRVANSNGSGLPQTRCAPHHIRNHVGKQL